MKRASLNRIGIACLLASLLTSCALLSRPEPLTTLRLLMLSEPSVAWPDQVLLDHVNSSAMLASNRIVVIDGAKVMQFEGLRWAQEPSVMWTEQLLQWQADNFRPRTLAGENQLRISVTDFSIHVNGNARQSVVVSARAELKCAHSGMILALKQSRQVRQLISTDAQTIASTFSDAQAASAQALISAAQLALGSCLP
jgi:ABC-type uncharacterized transport system auxiliary subunit